MDHENRAFDLDLHEGFAELRLEDLERRACARNGTTALPLREWVALAEAWRIAQALRETRGNRTAAARALGIGRRTLYAKMDKLGLEPAWVVSKRREATRPRDVDVSASAGAPFSE